MDDWDMSKERAHIETIVGQRFNYLLVFSSIIVAGAINAKDNKPLRMAVLLFGSAVAFFLTLTLYRAQQKLDLALQELFKDKAHPASVVNEMAGPGLSVRKLIGYVIPTTIWISLLTGFFWACTD